MEEVRPLMRVNVACIGSIGQLNFVSSIIVFNWQASWTIFSDSPFFSMITGLTNVFSVVRDSVFTGAILSKRFKILKKCCIFFLLW